MVALIHRHDYLTYNTKYLPVCNVYAIISVFMPSSIQLLHKHCYNDEMSLSGITIIRIVRRV